MKSFSNIKETVHGPSIYHLWLMLRTETEIHDSDRRDGFLMFSYEWQYIEEVILLIWWIFTESRAVTILLSSPVITPKRTYLKCLKLSTLVMQLDISMETKMQFDVSTLTKDSVIMLQFAFD